MSCWTIASLKTVPPLRPEVKHGHRAPLAALPDFAHRLAKEEVEGLTTSLRGRDRCEIATES